MDKRAWTIQFEPANLLFTLNTNSEWISEFFQREYKHLLVDKQGNIVMYLIEKKITEKRILYCCTFPDGSISDTDDLATAMIWINRTIKDSFCPDTWWPFHSGAVVNSRGQCVLLCGKSGSGKTTLCVYLLQHGWQCLTDDLVWFQREKKEMVPMPVSYNIREDVIRNSIVEKSVSSFSFPDINGASRWIYPNSLFPNDRKKMYPKAIILLNFCLDCKAKFQRMGTSEALKAILLNSYSSSDMALNFAMSVQLVKQIPVYQLWYSECKCGMEEIENILDSL